MIEGRKDGENLKAMFKKPNFSLSESHALGVVPKYFETSAGVITNSVPVVTDQHRNQTQDVNKRRLDARSSHFKVGFENNNNTELTQA